MHVMIGQHAEMPRSSKSWENPISCDLLSCVRIICSWCLQDLWEENCLSKHICWDVSKSAKQDRRSVSKRWLLWENSFSFVLSYLSTSYSFVCWRLTPSQQVMSLLEQLPEQLLRVQFIPWTHWRSSCSQERDVIWSPGCPNLVNLYRHKVI